MFLWIGISPWLGTKHNLLTTALNEGGRSESAGINRHRVGDERALHERNSCSTMAPSHARATVRLHVKR
jgi:hypothetical protein